MSHRWKGKRVAVLMGGVSMERDISLRTGSAISKALRNLGYDIIDVDVGYGFDLVDKLKGDRPDVAVIALHGKFGEDGCVQGMLEMLRIPYTGGGVLSSSVGMDKAVCTKIARQLGIPCPNSIELDTEKQTPEKFDVNFSMPMPVIVKPSREGSTINVTIVRDRKGLLAALLTACESDSKVIVEQYIIGKEITVGVLNGASLAPLEIAPKSGFYDYESKYTKGKTEYIVPARISDACATKLRKWTEAVYDAIECDGTARADYIVDENENSFFLEINTIPGMTELSLVPKAAAHEGLSFEAVCERLLDGASLKVSV